jgi:hypothetical protein
LLGESIAGKCFVKPLQQPEYLLFGAIISIIWTLMESFSEKWLRARRVGYSFLFLERLHASTGRWWEVGNSEERYADLWSNRC